MSLKDSIEEQYTIIRDIWYQIWFNLIDDVQSANKLKSSISTSISFEDIEEEPIKCELSRYISFSFGLSRRQIRGMKLEPLNMSAENDAIFYFYQLGGNVIRCLRKWI
jgi:hypothetical protein